MRFKYSDKYAQEVLAEFIIDKKANGYLKADFSETTSLFTKFSAQGLDLATYNLAVCYFYGYGVAEDKSKAVALWHSITKENDVIEKAKAFLEVSK